MAVSRAVVLGEMGENCVGVMTFVKVVAMVLERLKVIGMGARWLVKVVVVPGKKTIQHCQWECSRCLTKMMAGCCEVLKHNGLLNHEAARSPRLTNAFWCTGVFGRKELTR